MKNKLSSLFSSSIKNKGRANQELREAQLEHFEKEIPQFSEKNIPFFIIGCARSGTTMLRDLLRDHPRLECPEETHFFRWADPFGSPRYKNYYKTKLFKHHRELDGINPQVFHYGLDLAQSREHFYNGYAELFLQSVNNPEARIFDKTPQNVYGMFLINAIYPEAKFVHIYRNPLNVVTSLMEGKVMPENDLHGAFNYWKECMLLVDQFKKFRPDLLLEIKYEELAVNPDPFLKEMLEFVDEDPTLLPSQIDKTHPEKNKYKNKLTEREIQIIINQCEPYFSDYGYTYEKSGFFRSVFKK